MSLVGYIKFHGPPVPSIPKCNSKFEIFLVKIFKYYRKLPATIEKIPNFYSSRKQSMVPLDKGLQWVNVKQKPFRHIQANSGIIRHIQEFFRHIQAYSEACVTLAQNHDISRALTYSLREGYSESWHIHNPGIFRTPVYSERWHIQNPRHIHNLSSIYDKALCENS